MLNSTIYEVPLYNVAGERNSNESALLLLLFGRHVERILRNSVRAVLRLDPHNRANLQLRVTRHHKQLLERLRLPDLDLAGASRDCHDRLILAEAHGHHGLRLDVHKPNALEFHGPLLLEV